MSLELEAKLVIVGDHPGDVALAVAALDRVGECDVRAVDDRTQRDRYYESDPGR